MVTQNFGTTSFNNIKTDILRGLVQMRKLYTQWMSCVVMQGYFQLLMILQNSLDCLKMSFSHKIRSKSLVSIVMNPAFAQGFRTAKTRKNRPSFWRKCRRYNRAYWFYGSMLIFLIRKIKLQQ